MAINDVYEVAHKYRDPNGKLCANDYFYHQQANPVSSTPSPAQQLAESWNTDVLTPMLNSFPPSWVTYEVSVRNLFSPAEEYSLALSRVGTRGVVTELMPSYETVKATLSVSNGLVKKGRKAFAGMLEGDQSGGVLSALGLATFAVRAALVMLNLVGAVFAGYVFTPVVVKRVRTGTAGNYVYRLPETVGEAVIAFVTSSVISAITTTQVTRKD